MIYWLHCCYQSYCIIEHRGQQTSITQLLWEGQKLYMTIDLKQTNYYSMSVTFWRSRSLNNDDSNRSRCCMLIVFMLYSVYYWQLKLCKCRHFVYIACICIAQVCKVIQQIECMVDSQIFNKQIRYFSWNFSYSCEIYTMNHIFLDYCVNRKVQSEKIWLKIPTI